jgi:hypothetical protein
MLLEVAVLHYDYLGNIKCNFRYYIRYSTYALEGIIGMSPQTVR